MPSLKWKPPSENSIDFKLVLRFPPSPSNPTLPDLASQPLFLLYVYRGNQGPSNSGDHDSSYIFFDTLSVTPSEWQDMLMSGDQYDDRIVEVRWEKSTQEWKFMRFRDDKRDGNFITVVDRILESVRDGVELDQVSAWR